MIILGVIFHSGGNGRVSPFSLKNVERERKLVVVLSYLLPS